MRVGIDYRVARSHAPGVGRYARELTRALVPLVSAHFELALLDLGTEPAVLDGSYLGLPAANQQVRRVRAFLPRTWFAALSRTIGLSADRLLGGVELFHHTRAPHLPVRRALQTLAVSELPPPGSSAEAPLAAELARMDGLFVFSAHYERELARRFGISPARIFRVPVGCEHWRRALSAPPPRADPPELVVLGAIAARRRPLAILRAFEELARRGTPARLCFLGRPGDEAVAFQHALDRSPFRDRIEWLRAPLESELPARVARAALLVHLSADEGTPVTPLEAFALGTPVLATRLPAFEEALAGLATLLPNEELDDATALSRALEAALSSPPDPAAQTARTHLASHFTWHHCATQTLTTWQSLTPCSR